jgi:hypothetical protein
MTDTPVPTETPTPTPTYTPTPNFFIEMVTPGGEAARLERTVTVADYAVILLLLAILISLWSMYVMNLLRGDK